MHKSSSTQAPGFLKLALEHYSAIDTERQQAAKDIADKSAEITFLEDTIKNLRRNSVEQQDRFDNLRTQSLTQTVEIAELLKRILENALPEVSIAQEISIKAADKLLKGSSIPPLAWSMYHAINVISQRRSNEHAKKEDCCTESLEAIAIVKALQLYKAITVKEKVFRKHSFDRFVRSLALDQNATHIILAMFPNCMQDLQRKFGSGTALLFDGRQSQLSFNQIFDLLDRILPELKEVCSIAERNFLNVMDERLELKCRLDKGDSLYGCFMTEDEHDEIINTVMA
ncbi:hypothetical protein HYFRA_00012708 [Hymenoscyphus fraxineus]|uniref:Uncharacterized protein n=1 Tax=Hymenoscyphus fraxineus TaxID=746836 RepID=A0A9N9PU87_9HELO|nr:hypothetical protein HYFRA_00012708 [Hymenoscyphus fraxineus]